MAYNGLRVSEVAKGDLGEDEVRTSYTLLGDGLRMFWSWKDLGFVSFLFSFGEMRIVLQNFLHGPSGNVSCYFFAGRILTR